MVRAPLASELLMRYVMPNFASRRIFGAASQVMRVAALSSVMTASNPVAAHLGGSRQGIEVDRAHLAAAMTSTQAATHSVHILTTPNGGTVREFMNGDGMVFAIAWRGPGRPDLRQLLGSAFSAFQDEAAAHRGRSRRPLTVQRDDLVVQSGGHPGAFWGFAYRPGDMPAGFPADGFQ